MPRPRWIHFILKKTWLRLQTTEMVVAALHSLRRIFLAHLSRGTMKVLDGNSDQETPKSTLRWGLSRFRKAYINFCAELGCGHVTGNISRDWEIAFRVKTKSCRCILTKTAVVVHHISKVTALRTSMALFKDEGEVKVYAGGSVIMMVVQRLLSCSNLVAYST